MAKRFIMVMLLLLTTAGCAGYRSTADTNPAFSAHNVRHYDVEVNWRAEQAPDGVIRLQGTVTNARYYHLQDLELNARLVDQKGKVVARDNFADFPVYLPPGKTEPFRMEFRVPPGTQPDKLRFSYYYWLAEGAPAYRNIEEPKFGGFISPL
jgi:hypothetical protein